MVLIDSCGRPLLNLRIAITARCNLECVYCHKEGEEIGSCSKGTTDEMELDEIIRIANISVKLGISRIKITGGEPFVRDDVCEIIKRISKISGLKDLSIATNGVLLKNKAKELKECGLKRVNISLPTLNPQIYSELTTGKIENVLIGIKAAIAAGLNPVKLNMVVLNGINVKNITHMIEYAKKTGAILQLIELDPINKKIVWEYIGNPKESFFSINNGAVQELPNGNLLVTESRTGHVFELSKPKKIIWEWYNPKIDQLVRKNVYRASGVPNNLAEIYIEQMQKLHN